MACQPVRVGPQVTDRFDATPNICRPGDNVDGDELAPQSPWRARAERSRCLAVSPMPATLDSFPFSFKNRTLRTKIAAAFVLANIRRMT